MSAPGLSAAASPLLVPIQVEALVIEDTASSPGDELLLTRPTIEQGASLRWKAGAVNYTSGLRNLLDPTIDPFLGAVPETGGRLALRAQDRPGKADCGVHLRWIVPDGLRKSVRDNSLAFPSLPDQWLILRISRRSETPDQADLKAWVIDGSACPGDDASAMMPVATTDGAVPGKLRLVAQRVGRAEPLDVYDAAAHRRMTRVPITALGTPWTGSPTFSTSLAENRNILSWHDPLTDLRHGGNEPPLASVSYAVLGWHFSPGEDPLAALPAVLGKRKDAPADPAAVLAHLGWVPPGGSMEGDAATVPGRCLYHGQVAHINFWDREGYRGPLLGSPQSPPAHAGRSSPHMTFTVGLGGSVSSALSALVSDQWWTDEVESPDNRPKWAVLEGHLLGVAKPKALTTGERRRLDHALGFKSLDAGVRYSLVRGEGTADRAVEPTPQNRRDLASLNQDCAAFNARVRGLIARANALRLSWRERLVALGVDGQAGDLAGLRSAADGFAQELRAAQTAEAVLRAAVEALGRSLPKGWSLQADAEPRFWDAADPVVMLTGMPGASRASLPAALPCRSVADIVAQAPVDPRRGGVPAEQLAALAATLSAKGVPFATPLAALAREAALLEQAVASAAVQTAGRPFAGELDWRRWKDALQDRFRSGAGLAAVTLAGARGRRVLPETLVSVWGQQPWSPLCIDWRLKWRASPGGLADWRFHIGQTNLHYDHRQPDGLTATEQDAGRVLTGRSLIAAMDGRFTAQALNAATEETPLNGGDFERLAETPLIGQELTGLVAQLRGLNAQILTPRPDGDVVWLDAGLEQRLAEGLDGLAALAARNRIAMSASLPPADDGPAGDAHPFRAGWFRIEHLWVVDDFGQWAEPVAKPETRVQPHPRSRLRLGAVVDDMRCGPFAVPPRLVDGARLDVAFVGADSPIRGWLYVNRLDNAMVLCAGDGRLLGELALLPGDRVVWRSLSNTTSPVTLANLSDPVLTAVARWLADGTDGARRLEAMIRTVEGALPTIQSREALPEQMLIGRPLAITAVTARLQPFHTPQDHQTLPTTRFPLRIGNRMSQQDGLVGYALGHDVSGFAPVDDTAPPQVGFAAGSDLVLLMDPFGSVEFACGLLPARSVSLPTDAVRAALSRLEICFGVGPVLIRGETPILPPPASAGGVWTLRAPDGAVSPVRALSIDPCFDGVPLSAAAGVLTLRWTAHPGGATSTTGGKGL